VVLTDLLAEGIHALVLHLPAETWISSYPDVQMCVPKESLYPGSKTPSNDYHSNAELPSLVLPRGSLFTVTPEVHCLNIVGMVVSPRPAHSSGINVVGNDVVTVCERHLTDGALPVLFNNLSIKELPHLCFGAKLAVSPGVVRVFNTLHPQTPEFACLLDQLAATAKERSMNGTILIATEFHGLLLQSLVESGLEAHLVW
jgi:hypothetical protein